MRLIDALQESQWDYFTNCIYDCCNDLGATDNINANCLIDCLSNMEIDATPPPKLSCSFHGRMDGTILHKEAPCWV